MLFMALLVVFVINLLVVMSDVHETGKLLISKEKEDAIMLTDIIEQSISVLMIENRWAELQSLIENLAKSNPQLSEVRIFHPLTGKIIVSNDREDVGNIIYERDWKKFTARDYAPFIIKKGKEIYASRVAPLTNRPSCHRCHNPSIDVLGVIDVEVSLAKGEQALMDLAMKHFSGLIIGFVVIGIVFLIGGAKLINKPLVDLTEVMKSVGSGNLSVRANEEREDEFGYLSRGFNRMVSSLESYHLQQMERASKLASLGEVMSGIAHEIKNPLTGISCAIQVLNSDIKEDDHRKTVIVEILNQVKRLDRTVKDLLSYAKPKPPHFVPTRMDDIMEKTLFLVYAEARKQRVTIETEMVGDVPEVMVDPDQMQQVFLNMMINAVQAMPKGGLLRVSAEAKASAELGDVFHKPLSSEKVVMITFHDTGKGVAPEDLDYLFEPFFTKKAMGTGLGLSISQKIVHEHGGVITVRSEVGKGTDFTVYLPVKTSN